MLTDEIQNKEILQFAYNKGIIDLVDIRNEYEQMRREEYLSKHNHNVWQAKDGKWKTYIDDEDNPRGYVLKVRKTEKDIQDLIIKHYKEKESEPYIDTVFNDWNNQRLFYKEITEQSYSRYLNDFKRFFPKNCLLRQKKFKNITENDLESFIKTTIMEEQLSSKTYSGLRTLIRGIFKYGKSQGYTSLSITAFFGDLSLSRNTFTKKKHSKDTEVFSESEISLVTDYLNKRGTIRDLGLLLLFETGLRVGELSALKFEDIKNYKTKHCIHIQRTEVTYKEPNTNERICEVRNTTKTDAGDRVVFLPPTAIQVIDNILNISKGTEYVFTENNKRIRSNAFNRRLTRVCDELHIPHRSTHKIRKTYITTLIDAGVDSSVIAEQVGHTDITTTIRFYYKDNKNDSTKLNQISKAISC